MHNPKATALTKKQIAFKTTFFLAQALNIPLKIKITTPITSGTQGLSKK
jgi:hypothetical protein